jgi:hypothetical protein
MMPETHGPTAPPDPPALAACEHDWRIDPFVIYPTVPPMQRVVCAACGDSYLRQLTAQPLGVKTWPKA